jgi:hypothetical protein
MQRVVVATVAALMVAVQTAAQAGGLGAISVRAQLSAAQTVPAQTVRVAGASGRLAATLTKTSKGYRLTWRLTFTKLSGPATSGYIHRGKRGKFGAALFHLCSPCLSGAHGSAYASPSEVDLMRSGRAYVNVRTRKNPGGEIRGQISTAG